MIKEGKKINIRKLYRGDYILQKKAGEDYIMCNNDNKNSKNDSMENSVPSESSENQLHEEEKITSEITEDKLVKETNKKTNNTNVSKTDSIFEDLDKNDENKISELECKKDNDKISALDLNLYKEQIYDDKIAYDRNVWSYNDWRLKINELIRNSKKAFDNVHLSIENFNNHMKENYRVDTLEDNKLIENRIKGINMIDKMSRNVLSNGINKIIQIDIMQFNENQIRDDLIDKNENEIRNIMNENYNIITSVSAERSNLINKYFEFIQNSILPIIDGINSGINFIKNASNEVLKQDIFSEYLELKGLFDKFLDECEIKEIDINVNDAIDFEFAEVLDIEETEDPSLDEKVESVIRNGYEYREDVYGTGHNYVLRQAQVIAFKLISK